MVGGPAFGPRPRLRRALFIAVPAAAILLLLYLLAGCASPRIEYRPIPAGLIPVEPALPTIKAAELACLSDEAYERLALRDRIRKQYAAELRAVLEVQNAADVR